MGKQTNPEIVDKVIKIAREQFGVQDDLEVTAQSTFVDDIGADDLAIVSYNLFMFNVRLFSEFRLKPL